MKTKLYSTVLEFKSLADIETYAKQQHYCPRIHDLAQELARELFLADNPSVYFSTKSKQLSQFRKYWEKTSNGNDITFGTWLYWPWSGDLWHLLSDQDYYRLRTIRNRNIITQEQQEYLRTAVVAVAGLSVGLNTVLSMVRLGIGRAYKLADYDSVSVSNFNRSVYTLMNVESSKVLVAAREILAIDPYMHIDMYPEGLTTDGLPDFIEGASIIIDTFDAFSLKLQLRKLAKQYRIPVISGFDVEYGTVLLVERYDSDTTLDINFFLNGVSESSIRKIRKAADKTATFINIIGKEFHSEAMLESVLSVGKTLTGYPQLSVATSLTSGIFTYAALQILTGGKYESTRRFISLPDCFNSWT